MSLIVLQISLFGVFRQTGASSIELDVPIGSPISAVKSLLSEKLMCDYPDFRSTHLIEAAVLANAEQVLNADERFFSPCELALLPPVCGG